MRASELRERPQVEERPNSRMKWKTLLDLIGPIANILFWASAFVVRVNLTDFTEKAHKIHYRLSIELCQTPVTLRILISFLHSIFLLFTFNEKQGIQLNVQRHRRIVIGPNNA